MSKITVIDAPCGQGKTTWAIQEMNARQDNNFIFCTPFLSEIARIKESCGEYRFFEPHPFNDSGTKIEGFNRLLAEDKCIAVTHTTFLNATDETLGLIRHGGYSLIIDEALEVVTEFNRVQSVENSPRQSVKPGDLKMLLERDIVRIEKSGRVVWCGGEYGDDCKFSEVERFANLGRLYCAQGSLLLVIFPPELFDAFENVYILTYMFGGSIMKYYFDLFEIDYKMKSVYEIDGEKALIDYEKKFDTIFRSECRELIHICDNTRLNDYGKNALSKTWYNSAKEDRLKTLKNNIAHYFNRYLKAHNPKASNGDIMWTCMGEYENKLKGKGYTTQRNLTADERELPDGELKKLKAELSCFVPCNARATNDYKDRWALAYCVNMFFNPMMRGFFEDYCTESTNSRNGMVKPNDDLFAVSCMIQWIFRSRIREGLPIYIYIPNKRMRELLISWLNDEV